MNDIHLLINEMLSYKESLGYSRRTYEGMLKDFESFFLNESYDNFSEENVAIWLLKRESESNAGFRKRATVLREFSKYLYGIGETDYIIPTNIFPTVHTYTPYIFSDKELQNIFEASDKVKYSKSSPCKHIVVPVIFRLIYFCGLRPNEGRELLKDDFNYDSKILFIRKNKSHHERLIPMSDDMADMCQNYLSKCKTIFPDTDYLFPSPSGFPYGNKWLTSTFLDLWNSSKSKENDSRVRVYDLRHRYATAVFMKWINEGADLYAMLPYLSAYMGHTNFKSTLYYIHLLPENLKDTDAVDWSKFEKLIPEVDYE